MDRKLSLSLTVFFALLTMAPHSSAQSTDPDYVRWSEETRSVLGREFGNLDDNFALAEPSPQSESGQGNGATPSASTAGSTTGTTTSTTTTDVEPLASPDIDASEQATTIPHTPEAAFTPPSITRGNATDIEGSDERLQLAQSGEVFGSFERKGDRDEFTVHIEHPGQWTIQVVGGNAGNRIYFGVFPAPNGSWLVDQGVTGDNQIIVDLAKPGDYILRVWDNAAWTGQAFPYHLRHSFIPSPHQYEPNNSVTDASSINLSTDVTGAILSRGDRDEYLVSVPHHGQWLIRELQTPNGVTLNYGVYKHPNGSWIGDNGPRGNRELSVDLPTPGKYLFRVWATEGEMRSIEPYRFALTFSPSPDLHEPNNTVSDATPIDATRNLTATLLPKGDRDEYVVEVQQHGEWTNSTTQSPAGVELQYGVFPYPNGSWLKDQGLSGDEKLIVDLPKLGKYILRVWAKDAATRSVAPYKLNLAFKPSAYKYEPNNQVQDASSVSLNQLLLGTVLPAGDRDEYIVDVQQHGEWTISTAQAPDCVELQYGVYPHPNGSWLKDQGISGDGKLIVDLPKPGKYILRIWGKETSMRSVTSYKVDLAFKESADSYEPNNSVQNAKHVAMTVYLS